MSEDFVPSPSDDDAAVLAHDGWQLLPPRARTLFLLANGAGWGGLALASLVPIGLLLPTPLPALPVAVASLLLLPAWGLWLAVRRYRHTRWLLDDTGLGYRRGRMWHVETRVPRTRVQHVDLKHGPLERRFRLATLVVHTAGTRDSAVALAGLDATEATRLRDRLGQQLDDDDDTHAA